MACKIVFYGYQGKGGEKVGDASALALPKRGSSSSKYSMTRSERFPATRGRTACKLMHAKGEEGELRMKLVGRVV
jgi:hypothetical protein